MMKHIQGFLQKQYIRLQHCRAAYLLFPKELQKDIALAGKSADVYYVQKFLYTGGLLAVSLLLLVFWVGEVWKGKQTITEIERPKAYEKTAEVEIQAGDREYDISVSPVLYDRQEAQQEFEKALELLDTSILGQNESLDCITQDLYLPDQAEGYPFEIVWESDREDIVDTSGSVNREGLEEDTIVILKAVFYYQEWIWERQFGIVVQRELLEEAERSYREVEQKLLDSEKEQRNEAVWKLPDSIGGEDMIYQQTDMDYTMLLFAGLCAVAGVAVWIGQDRDLKVISRTRKELLRREFSSLVSSLYMYLSAGVNLQSAMWYCARDYERRKPQTDPVRILLQEFQNNTANGYSFAQALEHFAASADEMEYWKLANLLHQGMLHGNQGVAERLKLEVQRVQEEKRRQSKIRGEEISTALIVPMMLQLGIIFVLIMVPAFGGLEF